MPVYDVSYGMVDAYKRKTNKRFETVVTVADFPAALSAAAGLASDLANLTELEILDYKVSQRVVYSDSLVPGANKREVVTLVLRKQDNQNGVIKVPGPLNAIFNADGTVDLTDAAVTAFAANFLVGGDFTFSDGEQATEVLSGRLDK